ncbi:hypothetical protein GW17_00014517 [Ensete ventricosum]|nr:hypothetical protein GW17_00014517 [Ensete ventricosum]
MESRREFARRFTEEIGKLAGNMKGDHRKKTEGLTARMSEATGLAEVGSKLSLWLGGRPMLNSTKMDRIFSSMQLSKASNLALMASSDAMV